MRHPTSRLARYASLLLLALLPALWLWKLTLAGRILVGLDPFNFFYPYHDAVAASLAAGRWPTWNPALFGGVPFLADPQAQVFYPLAWPFLRLDAPAALTAGVTLHLALAALGTYAWARRGLGLAHAGAWGAGALFALGGYLGAQVEHVNQVQAAAWLPWLLLGYEWARGLPLHPDEPPPAAHRRRTWGVVLGALALALSFLAGHTQTTFISLVMLGLWALRDAVRDDERTRADVLVVQRSGDMVTIVRAAWRDFLRVNLAPLLLIGLLGALLAAVQLVPAQALSSLSPRAGGLSFREAAAFSLDPRILPRAFLPTFGVDVPLLSEYVGWIGFVGLALALVGALPLRVTEEISGPPLHTARDFGLLASGAGLLLAPGGYNPLFWLLWRVVPGFDLFRAPARWLLLWALGSAVLAGVGLLRVARGAWWGGASRTRAWLRERTRSRRAWATALVALGLLGASLVFGVWPPLRVLPWWGAALALAALAVGARRWWPPRAPMPYAAFVAALLLAELWAASWAQDFQGATAPEAYGGLRPTPAHLITVQPELGAARLLSLSDLTWDAGDKMVTEARHTGLLGEEAVYDLVVATKLKEVLAPNQPMRWGLQTADGYGGGLLPTARWVAFQETLPLARVVPDGRLREQLTAIPRPALLDVMGVEWLVADKVFDWWSRDVFHDLGAPRPLDAGTAVRWEPPATAPKELTALSFVVIGAWPDAPGTLAVGGRRFDLAEAEEQATRETPRGVERHLWLSLDPPVPLGGEVVIMPDAPWTLGALTLVDERLPAFQPLVADPALRATFGGDVKVYRRQAAPGRAWLVPRAVPVATTEAAVRFVADPAFDPRTTVIVEQPPDAPLPSGGVGRVVWQRDEPGEIVLRVEAPDGGWLVLADAPFPGWQATVDGEPVPWRAANVIDRALWVPPGEHLVAWRYRVPGLRLGAAGTVLGALLLAGWLVWRRLSLRAPP